MNAYIVYDKRYVACAYDLYLNADIKRNCQILTNCTFAPVENACVSIAVTTTVGGCQGVTRWKREKRDPSTKVQKEQHQSYATC